jgi:hypothetical protein
LSKKISCRYSGFVPAFSWFFSVKNQVLSEQILLSDEIGEDVLQETPSL